MKSNEEIFQKLKYLSLRSLNFLRGQITARHNNSVAQYIVTFYRNYASKHLRKGFPLLYTIAQITLTYRCQCRCVHCGSALYKQTDGKELTMDEVISLIDDLKKMGAESVYFFGGEPLLVPHLNDCIYYAKSHGLKVKLDTNGFALNEDMVKKLKDTGVDSIGVSLDSPFEAVHDKLRGVKGLFSKAISGIQYCKQHDIECYISTYVTKEKLENGELENTIRLAEHLDVKTRILTPALCGNWANRDDIVLAREEIDSLRNFLKKNMVYWELERIDNKKTPFMCTAFAKEYFHVSAYGDIQPCCFFPVTFGNIREEPLEGIIRRMWNSDMFAEAPVHECPTNNESFRFRLRELAGLEGLRLYPIRFEYFGSVFDKANERY